ncbi:DUF5103 domain-containing protein [Flavobacterium amniphilum]|uniref:type IX secretion system plug protein n=1 Tax=Flavobacterium amniphilum TaxID=1834035 RepID=UPI00202A2611|nr:DUF5103 domain-containing protein [Flavobacterium amniphilum]MCL9804766.1 DUF5103 domain-containing protein [Flavobacterium amniphilum]
MIHKVITYFIFILAVNLNLQAQAVTETPPPFNIKTISFNQGVGNVFPFFKLGASFQLTFDDLYGNEEDYYFTITHHNYNWEPSELAKAEYLAGTDNQRIQNYENSFNTLQLYSHYRLNFPNNFFQLTKSGNYLVSVFNNDKELVFSKKFIVYEELTDVPMQIKRSRNISDIKEKHNVEFAVKSQNILFQSPNQNVKVILFQNGKWNNTIVNIKPQYTIGNDLIFRYNTETQFFAGNEYLNFDNKEIRVPTNTVQRIDSNNGLYSAYLYTDPSRKDKGYTYFPDINGSFLNRNLIAENSDVQSDYAWMHFTLFAPTLPAKSAIYVTGMFNNYQLSVENKMDYDAEKGVFEKAILIKQGFNNYNYTLLDSNNKLDEKNAIDGNYYETENIYDAFIYYRANGERYDRVIGKGEASSLNITN